VTEALGVVLAGGAGERLGGDKAVADLAGRPLISYPLAAFNAAEIEAVVVAKAETRLPPVDARVITEPDEPRHPLAGIVAALHASGDRPVVVCACDMPFVPPALLTRLAELAHPAVITESGRRQHPLLARYEPSVLGALESGLAAGASMTHTALSLGPLILSGADLHRFGQPRLITFNVNSEADLGYAASIVTRAL
jgi:molybdopterin-guanine dinucleotide biosynthesis protein A